MRVSANIHGTKDRPRVNIFRSNRFIYAQAIDDDAARTLVAMDSRTLSTTAKKTKTEKAQEVGVALAALLKKKKITAVIFDRSRFAYNGRVKALAEGLRAGGITV